MDYMHGKEGDTVMVNGLVNRGLPVRPGQVQRWKVSNASNARHYKLSLENHTLHVVGTEGGLLDRPYAVTGGDSGYAALYTAAPAWKDVVNIPRMGSARILVPVMDHDGMSTFHCHIVEHEDIGMMGMWHIMGSGMPM